MPAFYAHKFFGEQVFTALPASLKADFALHKEAFLFGTQGPDVLFYYKPFAKTPVRKKALEIHLSSAKPFFERCEQKIKEQATQLKTAFTKTALAAYVAGFICHFQLDNACHPKVYALEDTGVEHGLIESEFDKYLKLQHGKKVYQNAAKVLKRKNGVLHSAATALQIEETQALRCFRTMKFINGAFSFPCPAFHKLVKVFLDKRGAKSFESMFLHFQNDPECDKINTGLEQDLQNAIAPTAKLVEEYFLQMEKTVENDDFYTQFDKDYEGV